MPLFVPRDLKAPPPSPPSHGKQAAKQAAKPAESGNQRQQQAIGRLPSLFLPSSSQPKSSDADLLALLADDALLGISELASRLGVTATAIRQRIDRLLEQGMVNRTKISGGRGRPSFGYQLTELGQSFLAADASCLAEAMWQEVFQLDDQQLRDEFLESVARRVGQDLAKSIDDLGATADSSIDHRMQLLAELMRMKRIELQLQMPEGGSGTSLPVLDIYACPFPAMRDVADDRSMCQLEANIISEALGTPVQLTCCRLDGGQVCRFSPVLPVVTEMLTAVQRLELDPTDAATTSLETTAAATTPLDTTATATTTPPPTAAWLTPSDPLETPRAGMTPHTDAR